VAALYLAGAALGAHLSPTARGPLLDGFVTPPPYRWVKPPASLAATNKRPTSARGTTGLGVHGSVAGAFFTSDGQANLAVPNGAFASTTGQAKVEIQITPLDPATVGAPPAGLTITGNVYRLSASYIPGGIAVSALAKPVQLILEYPVPARVTSVSHLILESADGKTWRRLPSSDSIAQFQVSAAPTSLGYVAVATPVHAGPAASGLPGVLFTLAVGAAILVAGWLGYRWVRRVRPSSADRRWPQE
jgi:hypothetical protein